MDSQTILSRPTQMFFTLTDFPSMITIQVFNSHIIIILLKTKLVVVIAHSVVIFPQSTEDVVKVVKIATKYRMPVIPYSGATSLEGHFRGVRSFSIFEWW